MFFNWVAANVSCWALLKAPRKKSLTILKVLTALRGHKVYNALRTWLKWLGWLGFKLSRKEKKSPRNVDSNPRAAGWEARMLPLCYAAPPPSILWCYNMLQTLNSQRCRKSSSGRSRAGTGLRRRWTPTSRATPPPPWSTTTGTSTWN